MRRLSYSIKPYILNHAQAVLPVLPLHSLGVHLPTGLLRAPSRLPRPRAVPARRRQRHRQRYRQRGFWPRRAVTSRVRPLPLTYFRDLITEFMSEPDSACGLVRHTCQTLGLGLGLTLNPNRNPNPFNPEPIQFQTI